MLSLQASTSKKRSLPNPCLKTSSKKPSSEKSNDDAPLTDPEPTLETLPNDALANIASYLATPSKAIFAVAMAAPESSWVMLSYDWGVFTSTRTKAILESESSWDELNFAEVESSLTEKIYDEEMHSILICLKLPRTSHE